MRCTGDQTEVAVLRRQQPFRPMHAISAAGSGQIRVRPNQQSQSPGMADGPELPGPARAVERAKMPVNHGRAARQTSRDRARIWRTLGIGEEIQCRYGRSTGVAVEPRRRRR